MSSAIEAAAADVLLAARSRRARAAALEDAPRLAEHEAGTADALALAAADLLAPPPPPLDEAGIRAAERERVASQLAGHLVPSGPYGNRLRHASGFREAAKFVRGLS